MTGILGTILTAVGVFIGTDIDDLVVLTVLFLAASATGNPRPWQIVAGQYVGVGALVVISFLAALGLVIVPDRWIGLLGLLPIGLGVYGLVRAFRAIGDDDTPSITTGVFGVAGVTMANGADNIAVYTPLFRTMTGLEVLITTAAFAVMVAVWCGAAAVLGRHKHAIAYLERWGHWIVPLVFIAMGVVIVIGSGIVPRSLAGVVTLSSARP